MNKNVKRLKRSKRTRYHIRNMRAIRLSVHRSNQHIYAQIIEPTGKVLASASTIEKELRSEVGSNVAAATKVGGLIAERAKAAGIERIAFDRSGYKYHGRVKALAEAARAGGLDF